jgi:hypothetical protein
VAAAGLTRFGAELIKGQYPAADVIWAGALLIGGVTVPQSTGRTVLLAVVAGIAQRLIALGETLLGKPGMEAATVTAQTAAMLGPAAIYVIDGQPLGGPAAGANSPVMGKHGVAGHGIAGALGVGALARSPGGQLVTS